MLKPFFKYIVVSVLTLEARLVLHKYRPYIIAVTGSVGKTSTKNAVYAAIENSVFARRSTKGLNSETGIPLSILGCESGWGSPWKWSKNIFEGLALIFFKNHYPLFLVLEVGADRPGDIQAITKWLKPDIAVITALPDMPAHIEAFASVDEVLKEKRALADNLKEDGVLVLNGDDKRTHTLKDVYSHETVLYGTELHNDIRASAIKVSYDKKTRLPVGMQYHDAGCGLDEDAEVHGVVGKHQVYPHLAALAVAHALGVTCEMALLGLTNHLGPNGRMRIIQGTSDSLIIDDSYNSSPAAAREALTALKKFKVKGRRIALLGDMLELGRYSSDEHKKLGVQAAGVLDFLVTVGVRSHAIALAAREAGLSGEKIVEFETGESKKAGKHLRTLLEKGDVVLVKGSQNGVRLERSVRELMLEPSRSRELLVRQEPEWLAKE